MEHLMAVKGTDAASFYRVPSCDHTEIKKVIDFAPAGIIVPMVMNAEEAKRAIEAMRYPPTGNRGCGFRRGLAYGAGDFDEYWKASAHDPIVILQLEHVDAYRDLDRILALDGLERSRNSRRTSGSTLSSSTASMATSTASWRWTDSTAS